jgi:WD40 repeat protein
MRLTLPFLALLATVAVAPAAEPVALNGTPPLDAPMRRFGDDRFRVGGQPYASALSPDGKRLAVFSTAPTRGVAVVTVLDLETGRPRVVSRVPYTGSDHAWVAEMTFSRDGRLLAVVPHSEITFVLNSHTGELVWRTDNEKGGGPTFCAFDADNRLIRTYDGETVVYDIAAGTVATRWPVGRIARLTPDAKTFVRAVPDKPEVEIGDPVTGQVKHRLPLVAGSRYPERSLALSNDGKTLAVVHARTEARLINLATGETRRQWKLFQDPDLVASAQGVHFTADDGTLVAFLGSGVLRWALNPFRELPTLKDFNSSDEHCLVSPDGKMVYRLGNVIGRWDTRTGERVPNESPTFERFALLPDGKHVALADDRGRLFVHDIPNGRRVREIPLAASEEARLGGLVASPDGKHVAVQRGRNGEVQVVPLGEEHAAAGRLPNTSAGYNAFLAWSPDGKTVYARQEEDNDPYRFVWFDVAANRVVRTLPNWQPRAISPDGREMVFARARAERRRGPREFAKLLRLDLATGTQLGGYFVGLQRYHRTEDLAFQCAAFSPDGADLAVADGDLISIQNAPYLPFNATDAGERVTCLAFTPDGKWLVSGSDDCAVKVWEVATGKLVRRFDGHDFAVSQVAVALDGRSVFSSGSHAGVMQWDLTPPTVQLPMHPDVLWAAAAGEPAVGVPAAWKLMGDAAFRRLVAERLPPVPRPDAKRVAALLAALDAPAFADRTAATRGLAALGRLVELDLKAALQTTTSVEARDRIESLLDRLEKRYSPDELRAARLVQACEWHRLKEPLTAWAAGAPSAVVTREAAAALARMK